MVFLENGGEKIKDELKIPKDTPNKKLLNNILRAIKLLYADESDKYSSDEKYRIDKTRECIGYLGI